MISQGAGLPVIPEKGVTITLKGLMPTGGYAEAKPASVEEEDVLHAYDISIYYRNGKEFEPYENSPISVSFGSKAIDKAIKDDSVSLEAEHIADNGKTESVELLSAEDGKANFEVDSFSIYVIKAHDDDTETTQNPRFIYHFLSPDYTLVEDIAGSEDYYAAKEYRFPNKHNEMVSTQIIKNGESLQEIVMPENNEAGMFYGWYVVSCVGEDEYGTVSYRWSGDLERQSFNEPINFPAGTNTDQDIYLAPLFGHYRFLTFHRDMEHQISGGLPRYHLEAKGYRPQRHT